LRANCKECDYKVSHEFAISEEGRNYRRKWQNDDRQKNPERSLLRAAKKRAKENNLPFNLELSDIVIPENCPALGIPLFLGKGKVTDNSPTVDKIIPSKGYVKDNIAVISYRANSIKRDATERELHKIADWMRTIFLQQPEVL